MKRIIKKKQTAASSEAVGVSVQTLLDQLQCQLQSNQQEVSEIRAVHHFCRIVLQNESPEKAKYNQKLSQTPAALISIL